MEARSAGVNILDTAIAYGESEAILGRVGVSDWGIVSKLPPVPDHASDIFSWMEAQVAGSLSRLGVSRLYGLLLHDPRQMHGSRAADIAQALERIAAQGMVARVGVSIQHPSYDLPAVLKHMTPGLIQSPLNLLDDALITQGWAAQLRGLGCEIHARSAFLQGLLLMSTEARPTWFDRWKGHWQVWEAWLRETGLNAPDACLRFVRSQPDIDCCIVGVESAVQLRELTGVSSDRLPSLPEWPTEPDADLVTPARWKWA